VKNRISSFPWINLTRLSSPTVIGWLLDNACSIFILLWCFVDESHPFCSICIWAWWFLSVLISGRKHAWLVGVWHGPTGISVPITVLEGKWIWICSAIKLDPFLNDWFIPTYYKYEWNMKCVSYCNIILIIAPNNHRKL
jgi:hypothetical protein